MRVCLDFLPFVLLQRKRLREFKYYFVKIKTGDSKLRVRVQLQYPSVSVPPKSVFKSKFKTNQQSKNACYFVD